MKTDIIRLLQKYEFKPNLMLDQSFMVSVEMIKKIVSLAEINRHETVLEVGSGIGLLTKEIAKYSKNVIAVEIDKRLAGILRCELKNFDNVEIRNDNILRILDKERPVFNKVISNTPYSICEALLQRLAMYDFGLAILTVPKGFAHILTAKKGQKKYSMLSFFSQEFFNIKIVCFLPKQAFYPEPKTNSAIVLLKPKRKRSVLCRVLLKRKAKLKNALLQAITMPERRWGSSKRPTKNEARKIIKSLKLNSLLDRKVSELGLNDIEKIKSGLGKAGRSKWLSS